MYLVIVECLGFSTYKIMSSVNRDKFTTSFLNWMYFISFSFLIAWARTSSRLLNRSSKRGYPFFVPKEHFEYFTIESNVSCDHFIHGLYYVAVTSFYS